MVKRGGECKQNTTLKEMKNGYNAHTQSKRSIETQNCILELKTLSQNDAKYNIVSDTVFL